MKLPRNTKESPSPDGNRTRRRREAGTSLLELALLMPVLSLLTLGVIDLGRLGYMSIEVSNAARAGAAYGAQSHITAADSAGMVQAAKNDAPDLSGLSASATYYINCYISGIGITRLARGVTVCSGGRPELYVEVSTTATYTPWFSYRGSPALWTLTGASSMRAGD
jgi:Flp pilus assembly protein TadG